MIDIQEKIVLVDLNYTLVGNQSISRDIRPFSARLKVEEYRKDLIEAIRSTKVIIITARPSYQQAETMDNLRLKTSWLPDEAYFNEKGLDPPHCKEDILQRYVFPKYGNDGNQYFAVESNPLTREMYAKYGIKAEPYEVFIKHFKDY